MLYRLISIAVLTITLSLSLAANVFANEARLENFNDFVTEFTLLCGTVSVKAVSDEAIWARGSRPPYRGNLFNSSDHGITWEMVYTFDKPIEGIFIDEPGNIFVSVAADRWSARPNGVLFKSSDGGETFTGVLAIRAGSILNWNMAAGNGVMFVSEYGYKGNSGNNARRIYRSLNHGDTWEVVFSPEPRAEWHNHKILVTREGVIYQSIGDGKNAHIIKSSDNGNTWETVIERFHPTSAIEFETHILWGLDSGPVSGISRYDKETGEMEIAFTLPEPFSGSFYDMAYADGIVYAITVSYSGAHHPASIWYSRDEGDTWNLLGRIDKYPYHGVGLWNIVTDHKYGYISIQTPLYRNGKVEFYWGTLRFELVQQNGS